MPSKSYIRLKKHRALKTKIDIGIKCVTDENKEDCAGPDTKRDGNPDSDNELSQTSENLNGDVQLLETDSVRHTDIPSDDPDSFENYCALSITSSNENISSDNNIAVSPIRLQARLRDWALRNSSTLRHNVISELLVLLREEGHVSLPKTAQTLLGTEHRRKLQTMSSASGNDGEYAYLGIEHGIQKILCCDVYRENKISVLVHIDGMQVYKSTQTTAWPITVKIYHKGYEFEPFVAGIYCGDSKPHSVHEFLLDFVTEANNLIQTGIELSNKKYEFEIMAITADSPARAYIKCCKGPGAFHACERCTTAGISVGEYRKKKRVYPDMESQKRTKKSFENRQQPEHHHECPSPLLQITNFDPTKMVVLDSMHLLYSCVMKCLLEKWILRKSPQRIRLADIKKLQEKLNGMSADIPLEFHRKKFDIKLVSKWKATQFRFFLHYCGPAVLKDILPNNIYQHFLQLFVACRILNNRELMIGHIDYADNLLRSFFLLLPTLYGPASQVLSMHNLIHVADDARTYQVPLIDISAFWGENYLGMFKNFVRTPYKPLTQIINRLQELESGKQMKVRKRHHVSDLFVQKTCEVRCYRQQILFTVTHVKLYGTTLKSNHPNNCVRLTNGKFFLVNKIFASNREATEVHELYVMGREESKRQNAFDVPTSSLDVYVGIIEFTENEKLICATNIKCKCVRLRINGQQWVTSLLHTYD